MISKIHIKNFRSIKDLVIEPKNLCALIGPNSAGKSNVMKAIEVLLGETYPTERAFRKEDFFDKDTNLLISIQIWFAEPLQPVSLTRVGVAGKAICEAISVKLEHTRNEDVQIQTRFSAYDINGQGYYGSGAVRDQVCFVYIPSERHLSKQMSISNWTLLGKILKEVDTCFRKKEPDELESENETKFREAMKAPKDILESDLPVGTSYKKFKELFIKICEENTDGLANSISLDLEIYDPLFYYKTIQIIGREEMGEFNVEELGSGVQNLILLSLFRTYGHLMKNRVILAIEEPEIFLYPQAQRQLYKNFISLAYPDEGKGTQIFYTTHNPNFVDASRAYEIELLFKEKAGGTQTYQKNKQLINEENAHQQQFKIYSHFNTERNELFFAKKVILVEGASDKILFKTLFEEKFGVALDAKGVSIIECGGKTGVLYFIGVCKLLGIENYFAIWDEDEDPQNPTNDQWKHFEQSLVEGKGLMIPGNLEKFLSDQYKKYGCMSANKISNAFNWALKVDKEDVPDVFYQVEQFVNPTQKEVEEVLQPQVG